MNNLIEKELDNEIFTIFFQDIFFKHLIGEDVFKEGIVNIPDFSFETDDNNVITLDLFGSGIIYFDNVGCNGTPFIKSEYEFEDGEVVDINYSLYFNGDNCPESVFFDKHTTLREIIELVKEKYLEYQKKEIDEIFEILDENYDEDDEFEFQDHYGYYIEFIDKYNSGELSEELTKYFDEKIEQYNVSEIDWDYNCFGNKTVYIKLNTQDVRE